MAKATAKKKKSETKKTKKSAVKAKKAQTAKKVVATQLAAEAGSDKLTFNHAMVYAKDVQRALGKV